MLKKATFFQFRKFFFNFYSSTNLQEGSFRVRHKNSNWKATYKQWGLINKLNRIGFKIKNKIKIIRYNKVNKMLRKNKIKKQRFLARRLLKSGSYLRLACLFLSQSFYKIEYPKLFRLLS